MYDFSLRNQLLALLAALTMSSGLAGAEENLRISPLVRAVRLASRSVVNIHTEKDVAASQDNRLFQQRHRKVSGMGTGLVVDHRGYIVTNYHVIDGVSLITVTFDDGEACNASVVSYDRREDLAIIRVEVERDLDVMPTGSSDDLMLAETVFAVGNAFGYEHTVTSGIISALHRNVEVDEHQSYRNLIQTDASINPGNSGGPLLNVEGDVIGINVAIRSGAQRIGFAIPIDDARRVIARLLSVERLQGHSHGIRATTTLRGTGLQVEQIAGDSPAAACGLQPGDIITQAGDVKVRDEADLERAFLGLSAGEIVNIVSENDGKFISRRLQIGSFGADTARVDIQPSGSQNTPVNSRKPPTRAVSLSDHQQSSLWDAFGIRVRELTVGELEMVAGRPFPGASGEIRYNGGLRITAVRSNSPAAELLRKDDLLLGLDGYETVSLSNLEFILDPHRPNRTPKSRCQYLRPGMTPVEGTVSLP